MSVNSRAVRGVNRHVPGGVVDAVVGSHSVTDVTAAFIVAQQVAVLEERAQDTRISCQSIVSQ